jgi:hypothetical protein
MRKKYKEPRRDKPQPGSKGKEAPANFHIVASSRILRTKETIDISSCSKMRLLRSLQISQLANRTRDWAPFRWASEAPPIQQCNQSLIHVIWFQESGFNDCNRKRFASSSQTFLAQVHSTNKCSGVSRLRRHSWQKYSFSHPLRWRASAVRILFSSAVQRKKRHFPGDHPSHNIGAMSEEIDPSSTYGYAKPCLPLA